MHKIEYPIVVQNRPQMHPLKTCRELFYFLSGSAYSDFIHEAHRVLIQTCVPAAQKIMATPLSLDNSLLQELNTRSVELVKNYEEAFHLKQKVEKLDALMDVQWEWSDLINPRLWLYALARIVYIVATKIWNLSGVSQKLQEIETEFQQIHLRVDKMAVTVYKNEDEEVVVSVPCNQWSNCLDITFKENNKDTCHLKAERVWECDSQDVIETNLLPDKVDDVTRPGILMTFDKEVIITEKDVAQAQSLGFAVKLMLLEEGYERLIIRIAGDEDLSSFGFVKYEGKGLKEDNSFLWTIDRKRIKTFKFNIDVREGETEKEEMTWIKYLESEKAELSFGNLSMNCRLFPSFNG